MSGARRFMVLFGCYAGVTVLHLVLTEALSQVGRLRAGLLAGAVGFATALFGVLVFRRLQGRRSFVAYTLVSASTVPLVLGSIAASEILIGNHSFFLTLLVVGAPAMAVITLLQRLLYSNEERNELRAATSWRSESDNRR